MQLTGILKDNVGKAETMGEKKNIIAQAGMELTAELNEDELAEIFGGHNRLDSSETTLDHNTIGTSQKNAPDTLSSGFNVESFTANLK